MTFLSLGGLHRTSHQQRIIFISCGHRSSIYLTQMASLKIHKSNCPITGTNCRLNQRHSRLIHVAGQGRVPTSTGRGYQTSCPRLRFQTSKQTHLCSPVSMARMEDLWQFLELENKTNSHWPRLQSCASAGPPHLNWGTSRPEKGPPLPESKLSFLMLNGQKTG